MNMKTSVDLLLVSLTFLTGVSSLQSKEVHVQAGEIVVLQCPRYPGNNPDDDSTIIWASYTPNNNYVTYDTPSTEQRHILIHGRSLVILTASVNHQGNYSCSLRNASCQFWFRLIVHTAESSENEKRPQYSMTCYTQESCLMTCPDVNTPDDKTMDLAEIVWHKEGESQPRNDFFSTVEEQDRGFYTCARLYRYRDQTYNMTFAVLLDVKPKGKSGQPEILSPTNNDVFYVDLGSTMVIDCKAVLYSEFDEVFWLIGTSFVENNSSFPVFYNSTWEVNKGETKMTASLIFKNVSELDLSEYYICKLESASQPPHLVNITLALKAQPFPVAVSIVCILLAILIVVIVCAKFKMSISLFFRDNIGCHSSSSTSDGKCYDAFLMYVRSHTDAGLDEISRDCIESVLEEKFGYSLCLYDRHLLAGRAEAEAVLAYVEQSRAVVLVPTSDCGLGSDVLNEIYGVLVERQIRLVSIKTENTKSNSSSLPGALELLSEAGSCVVWKGIKSMRSSSSFFKELRYYLPAIKQASKMTVSPVYDC